MAILSFLLYIIVAAACAWIADYFVPGRIPGGFIVSAIFGVIGAWIGGNLFGAFGPSLGGVNLLPAIFGSAVLIFMVYLIGGGLRRGKA